MPELLTYAKFYSSQETVELSDRLTAANIPFKVEQEKESLPSVYIGQSMDPMILLKVPDDRFEDVNQIVRKAARQQFADIDPGYYLFSFTDQELLDVLAKPGEWNIFDQAIAEKILEERQVVIPAATAAQNKPEYEPAKLETKWLVAEYLGSIFMPFVGIIIGLASLLSYKTLSSGKRVSLYDAATKNHAKIMLVIGIVRTAVFLTRPFTRWF